MPFTSKAQQRFLFAKEPEVAKEFAKDMSKEDFKSLPEKKKKKKSKKEVLEYIKNAKAK